MGQLQYLVPVKPSEAKGLVAQVYSQIKQDFGRIVEPFTLHSPIPQLLAGVWMASRESELVGNVPRETKEAIAACVSKLNQCPYCVDAHTIMLTAKGDKQTAQQIAKEQYQNIKNPKTRKIAEWTLATLSPDSKIINSPPFNAEEAPEIIGTAVFYHYINPLVTIYLGKTPLPLPILRTPMKRIASRLFKKAVNRQKTPGTSLFLLPERNLPKNLTWAKNSPNVAGAYARFAAAIKDIEKTYVPIATRKTITRHIDEWIQDAQQNEIQFIRGTTAKTDPLTKIATKIAFLTINHPYRIDKKTIDSFQRHSSQENQLLAIIAWASFIRATKIGTWLSK
ncbi:alkylhydroperoxidase [Candidatus Bathyarchaeota archaeon]|nr:alkylhydroperoxidase [Candidatus Bathyarchaeota archaeon]